MPDLNFQIEGVQAVPYAVSPLLGFDLRVTNTGPERVHTVALRCQIQIEAARRRYNAQDQERLQDLFGEPHRWGQTLRTMLWTQVSVVVPGFTGETQTELPVPCTFDFNVAAVKYFHGLQDGEIPLCFQFSGTVFYESATGGLQVAPISWDKEAKFRLPVQSWKTCIIPTARGYACGATSSSGSHSTRSAQVSRRGRRCWRAFWRARKKKKRRRCAHEPHEHGSGRAHR